MLDNVPTAKNIKGLGSQALTGSHTVVNVNRPTLWVRTGFQAQILFPIIYMSWRRKCLCMVLMLSVISHIPISICDNLCLLRERVQVDILLEALLFVICNLQAQCPKHSTATHNYISHIKLLHLRDFIKAIRFRAKYLGNAQMKVAS